MSRRSRSSWPKGRGEAEDDVRIYRRVRVQLRRAARGGDQTLLILTDLSKSAATGKQVAELYRRRWRIETILAHSVFPLSPTSKNYIQNFYH